MAKQIPWNKHIYDKFCELAMLSDTEAELLKTRIQGWTITQQAMYFHCDRSTINNRIAVLKEKYDQVQKLDPTLPKRKTSKEESYMDEN